MPPAIFTGAEIEKMRLYVLEHDKKASANEFDLNKPPATNYVHRPFPKVTYGRHADGRQLHRIVQDADDHQAAIAEGWSNEPVGEPELNELPLDPSAAREAADIDAQIAADKKAKKARK
ncbi:MAG: hypothetical protein V4522_13175 [Pseudomonadota bacterium]